MELVLAANFVTCRVMDEWCKKFTYKGDLKVERQTITLEMFLEGNLLPQLKVAVVEDATASSGLLVIK